MYWHHGEDGTGWGWLWMTLMMLAFWIPLLLALLWLARGAFGGGAPAAREPDGDRDPVAIARRTYARGELTREQYLQIIADLTHLPGGGAAAG